MKYNKKLFIEYFLLFATVLILLTIAGEVFPVAGRIIEAIGNLIKACGIFFGLAWISWFKNLKQDKKTVITALKIAAFSFSDIVIGILALIQFYSIILANNTSNFLMVTAFDYAMFLSYIYQHCELSKRNGGND
jgi:hypothetical protein